MITGSVSYYRVNMWPEAGRTAKATIKNKKRENSGPDDEDRNLGHKGTMKGSATISWFFKKISSVKM